MKFNKFAFCATLLALTLTACTGNNNSQTKSDEPSVPSEPPAPDNRVNVFVLSGQSNMEGNTSFKNGDTDLLANAFQELGLDDAQICYDGIADVQTSIYCCGYGELDRNNLTNNRNVKATNSENQIQGKFVDTKVGLGTSTSKMGPEMGAAYGLHASGLIDAEKPVFFIKMASNGSGFAQSGTEYNWPVFDENGNMPEVNLYSTFAKPFIDNNLENIKELGFEPVIRGWLWHQGESDSATEKIRVYAERLGNMVQQFRNDYAEYALDGDGENIAFIDGMIYQGSGTAWGAQTSKDMNAEKQKFADSADNNFLVDIYANEDQIPENELKPGNPGGDSMHYNTISSLRLGMAYAKIIVDNFLLEF